MHPMTDIDKFENALDIAIKKSHVTKMDVIQLTNKNQSRRAAFLDKNTKGE